MEVKLTTLGSLSQETTPEETFQHNIEEEKGQTDPTPAAPKELYVLQSDPTPAVTPVNTMGSEPQNPSTISSNDVPEVESAQIAEESDDFSFDSGNEPAASVPEQTPAPQSTSWQEAIKSIDKQEVLKAIGLELPEFALQIAEYINKGGQPIDFLQARAIDYNKVPDVELIRQQLRQNFPDSSDEELDNYVSDKYRLDEEYYDERAVRTGRMELKADAHKVRLQKIQEQQNFKIPDAPIVSQPQVDPVAQAEIEKQQRIQEAQALRQYYYEKDAVKTILDSKRVAIEVGEGIKPLNWAIQNADDFIKPLYDSEAWQRKICNDKGEPDVNKQQRILLMLNDNDYEKKIFNAGKQQGLKSVIDEGQNARKPTGNAVVANPSQKFAVKGVTTLGSL